MQVMTDESFTGETGVHEAAPTRPLDFQPLRVVHAADKGAFFAPRFFACTAWPYCVPTLAQSQESLW